MKSTKNWRNIAKNLNENVLIKLQKLYLKKLGYQNYINNSNFVLENLCWYVSNYRKIKVKNFIGALEEGVRDSLKTNNQTHFFLEQFFLTHITRC